MKTRIKNLVILFLVVSLTFLWQCGGGASAAKKKETGTSQSSINKQLLSEINGLKKQITGMSSQIKTLSNRINDLESKIKLNEAKVGEVDMIKEEVKDLNSQLASIDSLTGILQSNQGNLASKIHILEDKAIYTDSTNYEILAQLVVLENKIVSLTTSYNELITMREKPVSRKQPTSSAAPATGPSDYKQEYQRGLNLYNNSKYYDAIKIFRNLIQRDRNHDLADNAQYWIGESYYALKDYRKAIEEFRKVFTFRETNKEDHAQYKLGLCYLAINDKTHAREEFQKLINYYPDSEYYQRAKQYLVQISYDE